MRNPAPRLHCYSLPPHWGSLSLLSTPWSRQCFNVAMVLRVGYVRVTWWSGFYWSAVVQETSYTKTELEYDQSKYCNFSRSGRVQCTVGVSGISTICFRIFFDKDLPKNIKRKWGTKKAKILPNQRILIWRFNVMILHCKINLFFVTWRQSFIYLHYYMLRLEHLHIGSFTFLFSKPFIIAWNESYFKCIDH